MKHRTVIVRAFRGEPLKRVIVRSNETRAAIAHPETLERIQTGETDPVYLPRSDVYEFDDAAFQDLVAEWRSSGTTRSESWRKLRQRAG